MYFGEVQTAADDKGRIMVPQHFRTVMDTQKHDSWIATRGFGDHVLLFPKGAWDKFLAENDAAFTGNDNRHSLMRRMFLGAMAEVARDAQGRFAIPPHLREHAGIDRESVLIGVGEWLELWSKPGWRAYREHQKDAYTNLADELLGSNTAAAA